MSGRAQAGGFTLIELMISMMLGLVVIGGAMGVILANRQSYRTNEGLSQVQESARTAFELMARDIRQAGVTGCDSTGKIANTLRPQALWWQDWFGLRGYESTMTDPAAGFGSTAPNNRISGTDSIVTQGVEGAGMSVAEHLPGSNSIKLNAASTNIALGDILMVCDFDHAAIFQVSTYTDATVTLLHAVSSSPAPGNCTSGLGYPSSTSCNGTGTSYGYARNSQIARMSATDWYVGDNQRANEGGRSLYRRRMNATTPEEIVVGVTDMQIQYREAGNTNFVDAATGLNWTNINAVRVTLTIRSADQRITTNTNVNSGRLERQFTNVITLRNRVP
ncbi:prepilin-type N-terminal cleavage/methylation domain-containing protein [Steroidobacter sp.]|uniref:prepilin-type N-terminal cleavage/methylation domain-containing protein n=1 Tax=Steroidobacter sp. TaxID=1978227 RepID=UPI001A3E33E7|nr:prepilin-type N-terminal cleavage/methylation domain-containing protein [Steroidobacter sp.]MBL8265212.1 prepilin-type N-terminal cleavage/methylation domain-containing protein [Steroidobacter sp.]